MAKKATPWPRLTEEQREFVRENRGLAIGYVRKAKIPLGERDDCIQAGMLGLIRAVQKFDPDKGVEFSTYAIHWIRKEVNRHRMLNRTIKVPIDGSRGVSWLVLAKKSRTRSFEAMLRDSGERYDPIDRGGSGRGPELSEAVERALRSLKQKERDAVVQTCMEGREEKEYAASTGVYPNTVRWHRTRGMAKVRQELEGQGWTSDDV